jgi:hypothetical protein
MPPFAATASARASTVLRTRPLAPRFKIVSWLSITWDIPDSPCPPSKPPLAVTVTVAQNPPGVIIPTRFPRAAGDVYCETRESKLRELT